MESLLKKFEEWKRNNILLTLIIDEGSGEVHTTKGRILDFDDTFVEIETFNNNIMIRQDHIVKIKCEKNGNGGQNG